MRILHVATSLDGWGGIEKYIVCLSEELMLRGHDLYCTTKPESPLNEKFPGKAIPIPKKVKFDLKTLLAHFRFIRKNRIEVVHVHFSPDVYVGALAARLAGCKNVVMTRHVAEPWYRIKSLQFALLFRKIIAASDAVKQTLIASGIPNRKIVVARAGCKSVVGSAEPLQARFEDYTFGFIGRLTKEKGADIAIEAAKSNGYSLEIFGDGPEREALQSSAAEHPNIHLNGFVDDVSSVIGAIDCLVVPSRWAEAFPMVVLEAMSASKPVIAAQTGGLSEMVVEGQTGMLIPKEDVSALAAAMSDVATQPSKGIEFGKAGLERYLGNFTVDKMANRILAVYDF